jgi:hypothetical protein
VSNKSCSFEELFELLQLPCVVDEIVVCNDRFDISTFKSVLKIGNAKTKILRIVGSAHIGRFVLNWAKEFDFPFFEVGVFFESDFIFMISQILHTPGLSLKILDLTGVFLNEDAFWMCCLLAPIQNTFSLRQIKISPKYNLDLCVDFNARWGVFHVLLLLLTSKFRQGGDSTIRKLPIEMLRMVKLFLL